MATTIKRNTAVGIDDFVATVRRLKEQAKATLAELEEITPYLIETLSSHYSTGGGTRLRQIIWGLYNDDQPVPLSHVLSGLDIQLGEAVLILIKARIMMGADVESYLKDILAKSGEFNRLSQAARDSGSSARLIYPPVPFSADYLRDLANGVDEARHR